ncbi:MAG: winged helix-turn-helix domain-containing protein [Chloroflexota bacterium]|nr:winged helix-turn-helix domain-containing protein [Chloroflexota bacterium]
MDDEVTAHAVWDQVLNHRGEANHDIARTLGLPVEDVNEALEWLERAGCFELDRGTIDSTDPLYVIYGTVRPDCLS